MKIKIGFNGDWKTLPHLPLIDYEILAKEGIIFKPENINEESFLENLIILLGKYPISELMNKLE